MLPDLRAFIDLLTRRGIVLPVDMCGRPAGRPPDGHLSESNVTVVCNGDGPATGDDVAWGFHSPYTTKCTEPESRTHLQ